MVVELSLNFADLHEQIEMLFQESGFIVVMECPLWVISCRTDRSAGAAAIPPITDTTAQGQRVRFGAKSRPSAMQQKGRSSRGRS
jgi:hypothetical protein